MNDAYKFLKAMTNKDQLITCIFKSSKVTFFLACLYNTLLSCFISKLSWQLSCIVGIPTILYWWKDGLVFTSV